MLKQKSHQDENILLVVLITCIAAIGGFLFGFDSGVINGTIEGLQQAYHSNSVGSGFNVASMLFGCAIGAFFAGRLADKWGRRSILIISAVLFIVSGWGSGIASTSGVFVFFRILGGFAVGAASILSPIYIAEVAPARYRGALATLQQVSILAGLLAAFLSNYILAKMAGSSMAVFWLGFEAWRWMFWVEIIPALLFLFALFFIPESPRFLVAENQNAKARKVLTRLYGLHQGRIKLSEIHGSLLSDHPPSFTDLKSSQTGKLHHVVWVGIGLAALQQLIGINVIFYYGSILWQAAGFSEDNALLINVLTGIVSITACIITMFLIDSWGRKPFLLLGSIGMSMALLLMVYAFSHASLTPSGDWQLGRFGVLALISANAYVFFFNISWGPIMWIMLGEMFPNQIRGSGLAVAGLVQWGANFSVTISFPLLLSLLGLAATYSVYAISALISIAFVFFYVYETKGKELESMSY
ncbi:sugar porter family MFS transporter [uncultured Shewanella sp.]|uniref:sugar porter family MFS transporter n=1 Tax=uncultured Shewanella sp. TaxID=173975 RepID=UPI00262E52F3|nr:sugar porter family MFS transporter [uncultured Shewanella sp.]